MMSRITPISIAALLVVIMLGGCFPKRYNPAKGTERYPMELGQGETANVQVTRDGDRMVIVNGTAIDFQDINLWLNQRYLHRVKRIAPGETINIEMGDFWDVWGGGPNPGGLLRWYDPTPIVLVQAQIDETSPLVGFISILDKNELERR